MNRLILILVGPPGVGKGTQAKRLSDNLSLPHLSTGDLFRQEISRKSPLGLLAEEYVREGKLLPDALVMEVILSRLKEADCEKGAILDGVPRTVPQADILTSRLHPDDHLAVLALEAPDSVVLSRIQGRSASMKREDDSPEIALERMRIYHAQTAPLIDYFKKKEALISISCEGSVDEIESAILSSLQFAGR